MQTPWFSIPNLNIGTTNNQIQRFKDHEKHINWNCVWTFQTKAYLSSPPSTSQMQGPIEEAEKTFLEPLPSTAERIVWTGCVDKPIIQCKGAEV
jgi:hypothetical protein